MSSSSLLLPQAVRQEAAERRGQSTLGEACPATVVEGTVVGSRGHAGGVPVSGATPTARSRAESPSLVLVINDTKLLMSCV